VRINWALKAVDGCGSKSTDTDIEKEYTSYDVELGNKYLLDRKYG
jgi:hypothetical protein